RTAGALLHDGLGHAAPGHRLLRRPSQAAREVAVRLAQARVRLVQPARAAALVPSARRRDGAFPPGGTLQSLAAVRSRRASGRRTGAGGRVETAMNVAIFTDNDFDKVNGVTTTLSAALDHAPPGMHLRIYTAATLGVDDPHYLALRAVGMPIP